MKMLGTCAIGSVLLLVATAAFADATAVATAHSEAFAAACEAADLPAVLALYEDDAIAVWPGQARRPRESPRSRRWRGGSAPGSRRPCSSPS